MNHDTPRRAIATEGRKDFRSLLRRPRRWCLVVMLTGFLAVPILLFACRPSMAVLADQVQVGMSREHVEAIMGQPQIVEGHGVAWFDGFEGVGVSFDADDRVKYKTAVQHVSVFHYLAYRLGWR